MEGKEVQQNLLEIFGSKLKLNRNISNTMIPGWNSVIREAAIMEAKIYLNYFIVYNIIYTV